MKSALQFPLMPVIALSLLFSRGAAVAGGSNLVVTTGTSLATGTYTYTGVTVSNGATLTVAGGSTLNISGTLTVTGSSTIVCQGANTLAEVSGTWAGVGVAINAGAVTVDAGSEISADGQGYATGAGPGGSQSYSIGASYGGQGSGGAAQSYGSETAPADLGSGGGGAYGSQSFGGGAIDLQVTGALILNGTISASSIVSGFWTSGGSGGSVLINTGTLSGSGVITANGADGTYSMGYLGGGGRIAVYYANAAGYTAFSRDTASGAQNGTVGFFDTSVANDRLGVYQRFVISPGSSPHFASVSVNNGGALEIDGGTMLVDGTMAVTGSSTVVCESTNALAQVSGTWAGAGVTIQAADISVDAGSEISADGQGYAAGAGPGASGTYSMGAGYGGAGFSGTNQSYGNMNAPTDLGSGGGAAYGSQAFGGGAINLHVSGTISLNGTISASGAGTGLWTSGASGGSVLINTVGLSGSGSIAANGADGTYSTGYGGGGGRIAVYVWGSDLFTQSNAVANGGAGGQPGTVLFSSTPYFTWSAPTPPASTVIHDQQVFGWTELAPDGATVSLQASGTGSTATFATVPAATGTATWDTTTVPDGLYDIQATLSGSSGTTLSELSLTLGVNNTATWYSGPITSDEIWAAGTVNIVYGTVTVESGVTLTIAPGAIVKFEQGTGITVADGGILNAAGTGGETIILTEITDDSAGGDTNEDGNTTVPVDGAWSGISVQGSGQANFSGSYLIDYLVQPESGTLSQNQTWLGQSLYHITGPLTVPSGVTLTILPGAIVKFDATGAIIVQNGGQLIASGSASVPIIFTSYKDDTAGGDTNGDGNATSPAVGDWVGFDIQGEATFNSCSIRYGGNTGSGYNASGVIIVNSGTAGVTNSIIAQTLYDGVSVLNSGSCSVTSSILYGTDRAIWAYSGGNIQVTNCTIDNNVIGLDQHYNGTGEITAENCIISNNLQIGVESESSPSLASVQYCDVWSTAAGSVNYSGQADQTGTEGNISADPEFVNEATADYQLDAGSPCIDAANGKVAPLTDFMGDPRYNDPLIADKTGVANGNGNYPDMGALEYVSSAVSNIDLIVTNVSGPASVTTGDTVTVHWTDFNQGTASAVGPWHDAISLVSKSDTTTVLSAGQVLVAQGITLAPGQGVAESATIRVPEGIEQNYNWQVQVNSQGDVFEGANSANNFTLSGSTTGLSVPQLAIGGSAATGQLTEANPGAVYKIMPTASEDVTLGLAGAPSGCGVNLYFGNGYIPGPSHFDLESSQFDSSTATLFAPALAPGVYYVTAYASALAGASVSYTLSATTRAAFGVTSFSPAEIAGNGPVTIQISGTMLAADDIYELVGASGTFTDTTVVVPNSTTAYATFELSGSAAGGNYSLKVVEPGGETATDSSPIEVSGSAGIPQLSVQLKMPSAYRVGLPCTGSVVYSNVGTADMPAPLFILNTDNTAELRLSASDAYTNGQLLMIGASLQGPAGVLRAGERWSLPFTAFSTNAATIQCHLNYETADSTTSVDYNSLATLVQVPGLYSASDWQALWANLQTEAGPTWGGLIKLLDQYATFMAREDTTGNEVGTFYSFNDVIAYALADSLAQVDTSISGTLYLGGTNQVLAHTDLVCVSNTNSNESAIAESNADGTFRLLSLTSGTYTVTVPGYSLASPVTVTVSGTGPTTGVPVITLASGSAAIVEGIIHDDTGSLFLADEPVTAVSEDGLNSCSATSGAGGFYILESLPPGTYDFSIGGGAYETQYLYGVPLSAGQVLNDNFYLAEGAGVDGVVTSGGGALDAATVALTDTSGNLTATTTGTDGSFSITGLAAGTYGMSIEAPGYVIYSGTVALAAGTLYNSGTIPLVLGSTLSVDLSSSSNNPLSGGIVDLTQNGVTLAEAVPDSTGVVTFTGLASGTYGVVTTIYGLASSTNSYVVASSGTTVTAGITLTSLGSVAGQVTDSGSAPIVGINVNIYGQDPDTEDLSFSTVTGSNGEYSLLGLTAGAYVVTVGNEGGFLGQQITVPSSFAPQTANFTVPGTLVQGTVFESDGVTPLQNANVILTQGSQLLALATSDTNGNYTFRVLESGTYALAAGAQSAGLTPAQNLTVSPGSQLTAPALITGSDQLIGTVTSGNVPVAGATVALLQANGKPEPTYLVSATGTDGLFSINDVTPGDYLIEIQSTGYATLVENITLSANQSQPFQQAFQMVSQSLVQGTITDQSTSQPVVNASVTFLDRTTLGPVTTVVSSTSGQFSATGLAQGDYDVLVTDTVHQFTELSAFEVNANPTALNVALASGSTSLSGTVCDTSTNAISGATVSLLDAATGEIVAQITTADDGTWSTTQLSPGNYTLQVSAIDFFTPSAKAVTLVANTPQSITSIMTEAAADDPAPGFFESISNQIGLNLLSLFNVPPPNQYIPPPLPDLTPDCPQALAALQNYTTALGALNLSYDSWQTQFSANATNLGSSSSLTAIGAARTLADAMVQLSPGGKAAAEAAQITAGIAAGQQSVRGLLAAGTLISGGDALTAVNNLILSTVDAVKNGSTSEKYTALVSSFNDAAAVGLDLKALQNLQSTINGVEKSTNLNLVSDVIGTIINLLSAIDDYQNAVKASNSAGDVYDQALDALIKARRAYGIANNNCQQSPTASPTPSSNSNTPVPNPDPGPSATVPPVSSLDPNEKIATGAGTQGYVRSTDPITYQIDFENSSTASAPAQEVVITDQLDSNLDWSTFQLGAIGFNNVTIAVPPGLQTYSTQVNVPTDPNPVKVSVSLNPQSGLVTWTMESINTTTGHLVTDPLAGFLPPENAAHDGDGYITYTVNPIASLPSGAVIHNQADIVFDENAPIATNTTVNTIDNTIPVSTVEALPTISPSYFVVRWTGSDAQDGSGIQSYNVYYSSDNGATWTLWQSDTTAAAGIFPGQPGVQYEFYALATTNAGNVSPAKTTADAVTETVTTGHLFQAEVVLAKNDLAPGVPGGKFLTADNPAVDTLGDVVFKGDITGLSGGSGISSANNSGIWTYSGTTGSLLVRTGTTAQGTAGATLATVSDPAVQAAGAILYGGGLKGGDVLKSKINNAGVWLSVGGSNALVLRTGSAAADQPGATYKAFPDIVTQQSGAVAFVATLAGSGVQANSSIGLWSVDLSGTLHSIVRAGQALGSGTVKSINVFSNPAMDKGQSRSVDTINGNLAFSVTYTDKSSAIYAAAPQASGFDLAPVARTGEPAATGTEPSEWSSFGAPAVDANNTIVFRATLKTSSTTARITSANSTGIWLASGTDITLIERAGSAAPGAGGALFATLDDPVINNDDELAFIGSLAPAKNLATAATASGIWAGAIGNVQLVARQGDPAPGVTGGKFAAFSQIVLPDGGGPVFLATMSGVKAGTSTGLWSVGADGTTRLLGQTGDVVDVHGRTEVVKSFSIFTLSPQVGGQSRDFDAATRVIALVATFDDGTWAVLQGGAP